MTWNPTSPDGSKSVKQNTTPMQQNTTYVEDTMGNSTNTSKDHFWNIGTNEDGHHRAVQMEDYADTYVGAPVSPSLATGMNLAFFARLKSIAESPAQQDVQPYARNANQIMQILGIRACAVFNQFGTIVYSHNVSSVSKSASGQFTGNYASAFPSTDYLVLGGGMQGSVSGANIYFSVRGGASVAASMSTTAVNFDFRNPSGSLTDPLQGWFVCFGG